jgi:hypothetical protein
MTFAVRHVMNRIMCIDSRVQGCVSLVADDNPKSRRLAERVSMRRVATCVTGTGQNARNEGVYLLQRAVNSCHAETDKTALPSDHVSRVDNLPVTAISFMLSCFILLLVFSLYDQPL